MNRELNIVDVAVIGSGPAGQKAAIQAAKAGKKVIVIERDRGVGGSCVQRGTIPSKTLRESALYFAGLRTRTKGIFDLQIPEGVQISSLMARMEKVIEAHAGFMAAQLGRNGIEEWHGRARFVSPDEIEVTDVRGRKRLLLAKVIVIATGSRPRTPPEIPVDHEHILDSDSVLSTMYLPRSLTVLGGGVIASEYASIFACLGVAVTMIDRAERPIAFLDPELTQRFQQTFESHEGCRFLAKRRIARVAWDGVSQVVTELEGGEIVRSDKLLCALGRVANVEGLCLEAAGLCTTERGLIAVDQRCCTAVPHIWAVGDVIGPPSLASTSMEQGRRAMCHALGLPVAGEPEMIPMGIYTIPEMASVGLNEQEARAKHGAVMVGRANFAELARGQIAGATEGLLKLIADGEGRRVLGAQIVGQDATELIHLAQMALMTGFEVSGFIQNIFNFPTMAEAYRVAALDIVMQRRAWVHQGRSAVGG
jgi:NAD(P) transhydrogenase